jgi:putative membrane protein
MRRPAIGCLAAIAAALASCAAERGYSDISDYAETPSEYHVHSAGRAGEIRQEDRYFVFRAGVGNLYDITMAEIAQQRSGNPAIQEFARRVLAEASERDRRLAEISEQHIGIGPPDLLDREHAARRDALAVLSGPAFDAAYLSDRIDRSDRSIAVYQEEASEGSEALLTGFAARALPGLEREKRIATELAKTAAR